MICICGKEIAISKYNRIKRYCSFRCRGIYWRKNNPERDKELKKRWRLKKKVFCKFCKNQIPNELRKSGLVFCSDICRISQEKLNAKSRRRMYQIKFEAFKRKIGCQICGYNYNPCCLDFHHINPEEKLRRINAGLWYYSKDLFNIEIKKCKLLCKNCHYDLHHPFIHK
jgi:hypothetical protein